MIWVEDEAKVVVTLGSVWAWDHRHGPVGATYARFRELMAAGKEEELRQNPNRVAIFCRGRRTWVAS